ncbi:solute carrier family 38 member 10 isoform X2 [Ambystoma mexicanum]|uniref:solute carrier family 38 member 10 isoform X2 n=1 Tax=Ambystoma mexicanum TaxID=8296 RepID=UPI0037E772A5
MAASNWGLIMNIVNSIVGVSVLTMPFCFKQCGILLGAFLLAFCSWMTHQSCMFLVKSANLSKRRTYAGLAFHAYGKAGKMLVETSMIGLMLGTCIAFYVVIGDLGSNFFARLLGLQVTGSFRIFLLIAVSLCIVLPLSLQRNMMASIQSFSAMALIFYTVFMFVIVLSSFKHGLFSGQWLERVSYTRWEGIFRCIPIFGMSFACQSQVLPTYDSLDEPSVNIMSSIFASSLHVVTTFYVTVGFFGYVSFTDAIAGNVLMNFPFNLVTEMIRVGFMMSVAVGFPMMILPCRQALNTLLFEQQQKDGTFAAGGYMPPLRFKALTLVVVFGTMLGGILIPNVETILGLTGATMGSLICFICPALIYKKIHKNAFSAQMILGIGLGILVISTYSTLSVTEDIPVKLDPLPAELMKDREELNPDPAQIPDLNPAMKEPEDDRDKPKGQNEKAEVEQPQIKVPIEVVPQEEAGKEKKKQEEVQLDRPDQGFAQPVEKAHRHEPPIPHDDVQVDEQQDKEESEEKKLQQNEAVQNPPEEEKLAAREENPPNVGGGGRPDPDKLLGVDSPREAEHEKEVHENPPVEVNRVGDTRQEQKPAYKDLDPGPLAQHPKEIEADEKDLMKEKAAGDDKFVDAHEPAGDAERRKEVDTGDKDQGPAEPAGQALEQHNEPREARNAEGKNPENPEETGNEEMMAHVVLLQEIKEQQKQLLDQQEKLLAVIEEQHKEFHQQRQEEGEEKPGADKPQDQVASLTQNKDEKQDGGRPADEKQDRLSEMHVKQQPVPPAGQAAAGGQRGNEEPPEVPNIPDAGNEPQHKPHIHAAPPEAGNAVQQDPKHPGALLDIVENALQQEPNIPSDLGGQVPQEKLRIPPDHPDTGRNTKQQDPNAPADRALQEEVMVHIPAVKSASHAQSVEKLPGDELQAAQVILKRTGLEVKPEIPGDLQPKNSIRPGLVSQEMLAKTPSKHQNAHAKNIDREPPKMKSQGSLEREIPAAVQQGLAVNQAQNVIEKHEDEEEQDQPHQHRPSLKEIGHKESNSEKARSGEEINKKEVKAKQALEPLQPVKAMKDEDNSVHKENDPVKPNRDLKLQNDIELRRRRRDLPPPEAANEGEPGGMVIGLDPIPNVKVDDLRSALEIHMRQAAAGSLHVIPARQLKQIPAAEDDA